MEKRDIRKLGKESQYEVRRSAIKMLESGMTQLSVAKVIGVTQPKISEWKRRYKESGEKGLKEDKRGCPKGTGKKLNEKEEKAIKKAITDKLPEQMKLEFALWSAKAVKEVIEQITGKEIPMRTVHHYLKNWGFTPQKPIRVSKERKPEKIESWLKEEYPMIKNLAKKEKAEILWGDETGNNNYDNVGRGYSPKGVKPVYSGNGKRISVNMISAITNFGKVRFMIYDGTMNAKVYLKFLKQLIKDTERKVYLIVDNLKVHHAIMVTQWLEENKNKIQMFFLPAYCPELNPDEYLNNDLKLALRNKPSTKEKETLKNNIRSHMRKLQNNKSKVVNFFKNKNINYAA